MKLFSRRARGWAAFLVLLWFNCPSHVNAVPRGFVDELVTLTPHGSTITGAFAKAPTGDVLLFLGSKRGRVSVLVNPEEPDGATVALLKLDVCDNGERGLQTLLPHPDFETNGFLYIYRTAFREGCAVDANVGPTSTIGPQNHLSRFTVAFDASSVPSIDLATELVLLRGPYLYFQFHNGGGMAFGNDKNIYLALGDGGLTVHHNSRNPRNLYGSILRITELGEVPPDNPYVGPNGVRCSETGAVPVGSPPESICSEIYATGLRNPFRLQMDPNTKNKVRFFVGDVGGKSWEEINEGGTDFPSVSYGWDQFEGPCKRDSQTECNVTTGMQDPLYWYSHNRFSDGGAITAGAFLPNGLWSQYLHENTTYLFADFAFGEIYQLIGGSNGCRSCLPVTSNFTNSTFANANGVVDMFFGPYNGTSQALYYLSLHDSSLRRIRHTGSENSVSPTSIIGANRTAVAVGDPIQFDASDSMDPDGDVLSYHWDFDDGTTSVDVMPVHSFLRRKTYHVTLQVQVPSGIVSYDFLSVVVGMPPIVQIDFPVEGSTFAVGDTFTMSGRAWYVNGNGREKPLNNLVWEVRQHHSDHWHPFFGPIRGNHITLDPTPPPEDYVAATNSFLRIILTGYDNDGIAATVTQDIMPRLSFVDIDSEPAGMTVSVDGSLLSTPARATSWENHDLLLNVESQQRGYNFREWSTGFNQTEFSVRVPQAGAIPNYIAYFDKSSTMSPSQVPSEPLSIEFSLEPSTASSEVPSSAPAPISWSMAPTFIELPSALPSSRPSSIPSNMPSVTPKQLPLVLPVRTDCGSANPCGQCEGHCSRDSDCGIGLICFRKPLDGGRVPGCSGWDPSRTFWCILGMRSEEEEEPLSLITPIKTFCSAVDACGPCEGHCFDDDGCEGDLVCFKKDRGDPGMNAVPGCIGEDVSKTDWCTFQSAIDDGELRSRHQISSHSPTDSPSKEPTESIERGGGIPLVTPVRACSPSNPCDQISTIYTSGLRGTMGH